MLKSLSANKEDAPDIEQEKETTEQISEDAEMVGITVHMNFVFFICFVDSILLFSWCVGCPGRQ